MKSGRANKGGKPGPASKKTERNRWMEASWSDNDNSEESRDNSNTTDSLEDLFIPIIPPPRGIVDRQVSLPGRRAEERKSKEKAPTEMPEDAQNVKKGGREAAKRESGHGSQESSLNLQSKEAANDQNVTPVNSPRQEETRQERQTFAFAAGDNSGRLTISNQRFDLVGDSQNFTIIGPGNDLKVCSNKMTISVIGDNNVVRYNTRFTTDISANGRGNRAVGYEYGNGQRGTVVTSHNTSPSTNSLRVITTESSRALSSPPAIASSPSSSTTPPAPPTKSQSSGFLQSLRNVFSRNRSNNNSQLETEGRQVSLPGIRAEERKSKDMKESPIESVQNASTSATSTTAAATKSSSATKTASATTPTKTVSSTTATPTKTASATATSDSKSKVATKRSSTDTTMASSLSKISRTDITQRTTRSSTVSLGSSQSTEPRGGRLSESLSSRRLIVSQQNSAYEASLRADREKEEQKKRMEQEKLRKKEEKERKQEMLRKLKEEALVNLPEEPSLNNESGRDNNVFPIQIRFPSGTIIRRNFRRTDTVSHVLQFVFSHPECPINYSFLRRPNGIFTPGGAENDIELGELGFTSSETLLVQSEEEDD